MSGEELDQLAEAELPSAVKNVMISITKIRPISHSIHLLQDCNLFSFIFQVSIFFRTSPKHKLKIIKVLTAPHKNRMYGGRDSVL